MLVVGTKANSSLSELDFEPIGIQDSLIGVPFFRNAVVEGGLHMHLDVQEHSRLEGDEVILPRISDAEYLLLEFIFSEFVGFEHKPIPGQLFLHASVNYR